MGLGRQTNGQETVMRQIDINTGGEGQTDTRTGEGESQIDTWTAAPANAMLMKNIGKYKHST